MKKILVPLVAILLAAGCNVQNIKVNQNSPSLNNSTSTTTDSKATSSAQNKNLNIYANSRYGYEFSLPSGYSAQSGIQQEFAISGPQGTFVSVVAIFLTKDGQDANETVAAYPSRSDNKILGIEHLGNYDWLEFTNSSNLSLNFRTEYNGVAVVFQESQNQPDANLKNILASFKFISLPFTRLDQTIATMKVGDKFGDFQVSYIKSGNSSKKVSAENVEIGFNGQSTITGEYNKISEIDGTSVRFSNLDAKSVQKIPKIDPNYSNTTLMLYFNNDDLAKKLFKNDSGNATITIKNLVESFHLSDIGFTADLISVNSAE